MSITDQFLVTDRVAVVTGAGRGIGRETALTLAAAGADVVISSRTQSELDSVAAEVAALGRRAVAVAADASEVEHLHELIDAAVGTFGGVDIVVNNVGGSFPRPLLETSARMFEKAFRFNVTTALELSKAAIPPMLERGGGSIVNISSAIGRMSDRGFAAYGTAKAALTHLTELMAVDCAPKIRVNAIAVGSTETSALEMVLTDDELRSRMEAGTPLRRLGRPLDIALGVLYLCSPAGSFLTGKTLEIDGGLNAPNLALDLPDLG
jgi:7-alpha-hydroxysteroid dehydrogenase